MSDLIDTLLTAHGGLDRWSSYSQLTAHIKSGGVLWDLKGQPGVLADYTITASLQEQAVAFTPFAEPGLRGVYTPARVAVETLDGEVVEERTDPRKAFAGHTLETPWDRLHTVYFAGYAMWTYLNAPFLFRLPGVTARELDPWTEEGETWRRLQVTFPADIATHTTVQTFFVDTKGRIRRHGYAPDVLGPADRDSAHYYFDHQRFGGILFPTDRRVYLTDESDHKVPEPVLISISLSDIQLA